MNTLQQAFINGFVKRAAQYGVNEYQAIELLKSSEELKGDQHKLDVDHDGKIEAEDLKKLRARKTAADNPIINTGTMQGSAVSKLKKLKAVAPDNQVNPSFGQQLGNLWQALKGSPPQAASTYNQAYKP